MQPDNSGQIIKPDTDQTNNSPGQNLPTPPSAPEPSAEPVPSSAPSQPKQSRPKKKLVIIILILLLISAGAAAAYWFFIKEKDTPEAEVSTSLAFKEPEQEESKIPEGYTEYKNEAEGITFIYPEIWGEVSMISGHEEEMGHLVKGSEKLFNFSNNKTVSAGVMSVDWEHDPNSGHGGVVRPGIETMSKAKEIKQYIKTSEVFVDSDSQFAYVGICYDYCSDEPFVILKYTIALPSNPKYQVIEFYQDGEKLGPEFYIAGEKPYPDQDKINELDKSTVFKKTDQKFLDIQKIANHMTSQTED